MRGSGLLIQGPVSAPLQVGFAFRFAIATSFTLSLFCRSPTLLRLTWRLPGRCSLMASFLGTWTWTRRKEDLLPQGFLVGRLPSRLPWPACVLPRENGGPAASARPRSASSAMAGHFPPGRSPGRLPRRLRHAYPCRTGDKNPPTRWREEKPCVLESRYLFSPSPGLES